MPKAAADEGSCLRGLRERPLIRRASRGTFSHKGRTDGNKKAPVETGA